MTDEKRSEESRRYGNGTRNEKERREEASNDWKFYEKRLTEDRRTESRRNLSERRLDENTC